MSIFFLIIVLSVVIPAARRLYRNSQRGQIQDPGMSGGLPGQFPGGFPGQQSNQPRDGMTQRDYYGGFGQFGAPQPPANQQYPNPQYPGQQYPVPYEDSPEYLNNPPQAAPQQPQWQSPAQPPSSSAPGVPPVPPVPSGPQGYRARRLAELDQKYSNGELSMEDYMAQRAEIMKG